MRTYSSVLISVLLSINLPVSAYAINCDDPNLLALVTPYDKAGCVNNTSSSFCVSLESLYKAQHKVGCAKNTDSPQCASLGSAYKKCRVDSKEQRSTDAAESPSTESPSTNSAIASENPTTARQQTIAEESDGDFGLADAMKVLAIPIGTPLNEVQLMLLADNFAQVGQCGFIKGADTMGGKGVTVILSTEKHSGSGCDIRYGDRPVVKIYVQDGSLAMSEANHTELIARLNQEIGAEGSCKDLSSSKADCAWTAPRRFPDAALIKVKTRGFRGFEIEKENLKWPEKPARVESLAGTAFDPLSLIGDVDPLAPGGVAVGMALEDANEGLTANGLKIFRYGTIRKTCEWRLERPNEVSLNIKIYARKPTGGAAAGFSQCMDGAIIRNINYRKTDHRNATFSDAKTGAETVVAISRRMGNEGRCKYIDGPAAAGGRATSCRWDSPPKAPGIESLLLEYLLMPRGHAVSLSLQLTGAAAIQASIINPPASEQRVKSKRQAISNETRSVAETHIANTPAAADFSQWIPFAPDLFDLSGTAKDCLRYKGALVVNLCDRPIRIITCISTSANKKCVMQVDNLVSKRASFNPTHPNLQNRGFSYQACFTDESTCNVR